MGGDPAIVRPKGRHDGTSGFTLVELIIVLGMLVVVLGVTYRIVLDCLDAERTVDRLSLPDKVGEGILALIRTDLSGVFYRNMGRRIFFVFDAGLPPDSRDEVRFLTTVEPTPIEEPGYASTLAVRELRTVMGAAYFLRPTQLEESVTAFTLFRREMVELDPAGPLDGLGTNFEVYDKVAYFNVECFDGWSWYQDWDSEMRIQSEEADLAANAATYQGRVGRVSDPSGQGIVGLSTPGVAPTTAEGEEIPPPAGVPVAVRVELGIYVSSGGRILRDPAGTPVLKTYSTLVPILVAQRLPIDIEEALAMSEAEGGGFGEESGAAGGSGRRTPDYRYESIQVNQGRGSGRGSRGAPGIGGRGPGGGRRGGGEGPPGGGRSPTGRTIRRPAGGSMPGGAIPGGAIPGGTLPSGGRGGRGR